MNAAKQRDYMRKLFVDMGGDRDKACAAYARAERDGIVSRSRNTHDMLPEDYANALWKDGVKKGWLTLSAPPTSEQRSASDSPETGSRSVHHQPA